MESSEPVVLEVRRPAPATQAAAPASPLGDKVMGFIDGFRQGRDDFFAQNPHAVVFVFLLMLVSLLVAAGKCPTGARRRKKLE